MSRVPRDTRKVSFVCNGADVAVAAGPDRLLLDVLREDLDLTGAKLGCGTGDCGACMVLIDGKAVNACLVYAAECEAQEVQTPESVADTAVGSVVVDELVARGAIQCGICTPGIVVSTVALLKERSSPPDRGEIEVALAGNLCRCTGYLPIIEAVASAAERTLEGSGPGGA